MSGKIRITIKRGQDESVFANETMPGASEQPGFVEPKASIARKNGHAKRSHKGNTEESAEAPPVRAEPAEPELQTAIQPAPVPNDDSVHGVPYVRMLNRSSVVVAVPAHDVPARVHCGFQFIFNEPAVPRVLGNPDLCDKAGPGWVPFPRQGGAGIKKMSAAVAWWISCMMDDRASRDSISKQVDWTWLDKYAPAMRSSMASMEP